MGRRKIEIKAIKDDRNRSVTFLKRKGGLFKKAHELSVLCSVDVAVFIFGSNKKLYEYSSCDMRDMVTRWSYHGGPNEHKGPSDFNGGNDDGSDEEGDGTPPHQEPVESHMMPPQFPGQGPFQQHMRHTPSASPPIGNGVQFPPGHPGHAIQRGHTPQPNGSRPGSRNDMRRMGPAMVAPPQGPAGPQGPQHPVNGFAYVPQPPIYNPQNAPAHALAQQTQYPYHGQQSHAQMQQQYAEEQRRRSLSASFPAQGPPPMPPQHGQRPEQSPPQPHPREIPPQQVPHISPPPPQPPQIEVRPAPQPPPPEAAPMEPGLGPKPAESRPQRPLLDTNIKKLPQRKQHSIFTPIDEDRSILSQHLASFADPKRLAQVEGLGNRSQSVDVGAVQRSSQLTKSPPMPERASTTHSQPRPAGVPDNTFSPPSRTNSLRVGGIPARPRLTVQIPDEQSDRGSGTAESSSPRGSSDVASNNARRGGTEGSHSSGIVLPPPSPSASALLSAGASGPPNPFARPPPAQNNGNNGNGAMNIDTPVSALPSRFLNNEFLPSPSSFYPEWNFRGSDSNTLPSPLNFVTPVGGSAPSFLRDESAALPPVLNGGAGGNGRHKRKSPELNSATVPPADGEAKRVRVEG